MGFTTWREDYLPPLLCHKFFHPMSQIFRFITKDPSTAHYIGIYQKDLLPSKWVKIG